jgi:hypothetical protein
VSPDRPHRLLRVIKGTARRPDPFAHGPNGNGGMCPRIRSFATLPGSGFTITMPPSSGVTPVSGRMLAPCVTTTSVRGSVQPNTIARAPAVQFILKAARRNARAAFELCVAVGCHRPVTKSTTSESVGGIIPERRAASLGIGNGDRTGWLVM